MFFEKCVNLAIFRILSIQVHKIACNHLISKDMSLVPLASSETAWCWFAVDHSEGCPPEGRHDQLAVRSVGLLMKYVLKYQSLTNQLGQKKKGKCNMH